MIDPVADLLGRLRRRGDLGRDVPGPRRAAASLPGPARHRADVVGRGVRRALPLRDDLLETRASPSRCRARSGRSPSTSCPASSPRRVVGDRAGRGPAGAGPRGVPRRRVRPRRDHGRPGRAPPPGHQLHALPAGRGRHPFAERCAGPRGGHRPGARRARRVPVLEDNLRTPSGISYVVENRRTMTHVLPGFFARQRVRPVTEYPTRLASPASPRPRRCRRPHRGRAHPGRLQLGPLRARLPGPPDGRAGRGPRPPVPATVWCGCAPPRA